MQYIIQLDKINSLPSVKGGDIINIADGIYNNINLSLNYNGNEKNQITIQALNYGKVILQGQVTISINGSYISFGNMIISGTGKITVGGHHNRLTNCDISLNSPSIFIDSDNSRVDHCILHDFTRSGQWFEVSRVNKNPNYILIDHNLFKNRRKGTGNGFETIRLGTSTHSLSNSNSIIAYNTFENCDGEIEIISIKASNNIVYKNNFKNSFGSLTLRHGNNNLIVQNKFLQGNEASAGGVRVAAGENHILYNNLIKDASYGIRLDNGESSGIYNLAVKNTKIIKNVFINNERDIVIGTAKFSVKPINSLIDNNLVYKINNNPVFEIPSSTSIIYTNNKYYATNKGTILNNEVLRNVNEFNIVNVDFDNYGYDENYIGVQSMININETEITINIDQYFTYLKTSIINEINGQCFNDTVIIQPTWTNTMYEDEPLLPTTEIPNGSSNNFSTKIPILFLLLFLFR